MAHPPRIPVLLPEEKTVTYFLTLCVQDRQPALADQQCMKAFEKASARVKKWQDWPYAFGF